MKKYLLIIFIIVLVIYFFRDGGDNEPAGATKEVSPDVQVQSNAGDSHKNTYAVVVGVSDYLNMQPGKGDLSVPTVDAQRVYNFFRSAGGGAVPENNIYLLLNADATRSNIVAAMSQLYSKAGPEDRVVFFFAGHGDKGFFLPYEYDGSQRTALFHDDVKAAFKGCAAKTKLCIADACHSGSIKSRSNDARLQPSVSKADTGSTKYRELEDGSGIVVMMAAKSNEVSWETQEIGQGVFSYFLVKGLAGQADKNQDRVISITELYFYVRNNVRQYVYNSCKDESGRPAVQTPICFGKFNKDMPVGYVY